MIQATLAGDFGLEVNFRETTTICVERPVATGEAVEILHAESNPFLATMGLRVEPAPTGSGVDFRLDVDPRTVPLYIYKTLESFTVHMGQYMRETLREGLFGWQVTDCTVTMTRCIYSIPDGPPSRRGPPSTAADFRKLTPLVLMQALEQAGTVVCEPVIRVKLELPTETIGAVLAALARLGAAVEDAVAAGRARDDRDGAARGPGAGPAAAAAGADRRRRRARVRASAGTSQSAATPPTRRRTTANPLNRAEYMLHLARRASG